MTRITTESYSGMVKGSVVVFEHLNYTTYRLTVANELVHGEINTERGYKDDKNATVYILNSDGPQVGQVYFVRSSDGHFIMLDEHREILMMRISPTITFRSGSINSTIPSAFLLILSVRTYRYPIIHIPDPWCSSIFYFRPTKPMIMRGLYFTLARRSLLTFILGATLFPWMLNTSASHSLHPRVSGRTPPGMPYAQNKAASSMGVAGIGEPSVRWSNKVSRITSRDHRHSKISMLKAAKLPEKLANYDPNVEDDFGMAKSIQPTLGANFEANWSLMQTPPDNSMAISNGGHIVTANNDEVLYMSTNRTLNEYYSWADFFSNQQLNANIYDPGDR